MNESQIDDADSSKIKFMENDHELIPDFRSYSQVSQMTVIN